MAYQKTFPDNPQSIYFPQKDQSSREVGISWSLTSAEQQRYNITGISLCFTASSDGYYAYTFETPGGTAVSRGTFQSWSSHTPDLSFLLSDQTWLNKSNGTIYIRFKNLLSASINQTYSNIRLVVDLEPKATASTATVDTVNVGTSQTVTISNDVNTVNHKVTFTYGSVTSGELSVSAGTTTVSWAVPSASIQTVYAANPTSSTVAGTVTVDTYMDSTLIGSVIIPATLTIPSTSDTQPTNSSTIQITRDSIAQAATKDLRNHVNVTVTPSAAAKYSATISSYLVTVTNSAQTVFQQTISSATTFQNVSWPAGTNTVTVTATDSRGISSDVSQSVVLVAYINPFISQITVERYDLSTSQPDDEGTAIRVTIVGACDSQTTITRYDASIKLKGSSSPTTAYSNSNQVIFNGPFSTENTFEITATVTDSYGSVSDVVTTEIGTSTYTIYRMAGGKGVAFGTVAKRYGVEVYEDWPFYTHGQEIQEMLIDYSHPVGSIIQTLDADFDPNQQWQWTQWGKLENVFLLGSGTKEILTTGGCSSGSSASYLVVNIWVRSR